MAKTSAVEKNKRRARLVKRYAAKRAALKAIAHGPGAADRRSGSPRSSSWPSCRATARPMRIRNRCELTGRPRAFYRKFRLSRIALRELGLERADPGHGQGELVREDRKAHGDERSPRRYADPHPQRPAGAQAARRRARLPSCASNVLEVLKREGYIRGFAQEELRPASPSCASS